MIIKLVRTDTIDSCKIPLILGEHVIGRGEVLGCDDKRISRHHGKLEVSDTLSLKALHKNPCFFTSKDSTEVVILRQGDSKTLLHGDKFGLLPDAFWYEVLFCPDLEEPICDSEKNTEEYCVDGNDSRESGNESRKSPSVLGMENCDTTCISHSLPASKNLSDNVIKESESGILRESCNHNEPNQPSVPDNPNQPDNQHESNTLQKPDNHNESDKNNELDNHNKSDNHNEADNHNESENVRETDKPNESDNQNEPSKPDEAIVKIEPTDDSPNNDGNDSNEKSKQIVDASTKRSHSPDNVDAKKIKIEVKNELDYVKPGPSLNQGQAPANNGVQNVNNGAPNNDGRNNPLRERCMYGANCYRRRPEHLAKYSHPRDADWGPGARAMCPYGAACAKTDPRHWRDHDHPPGKLPPPRPGMQVVERHGNVFFINARSVNFYDDHFQVEDSDGDSVDFDYEF